MLLRRSFLSFPPRIGIPQIQKNVGSYTVLLSPQLFDSHMTWVAKPPRKNRWQNWCFGEVFFLALVWSDNTTVIQDSSWFLQCRDVVKSLGTHDALRLSDFHSRFNNNIQQLQCSVREVTMLQAFAHWNVCTSRKDTHGVMEGSLRTWIDYIMHLYYNICIYIYIIYIL